MGDTLSEKILAIIAEVVARKGGASSHSRIGVEQALVADLGLASLDLAEIVALAEAETDLNPFASGASITNARTVGALIEVYRAAADVAPRASAGAR